MMKIKQKNIWTIGHSTRTIDHFISMLHSFNIESVADIRSFPGSRRYPHFNKEALTISLPANGIKYIHLKDLGGRRPAKPDSINTGWRNAAFRGFADYMQTDDFKKGIEQLEEIAATKRTAYMCSEAIWWRCHRSLVSDYLKLEGWTVYHIMEIGKAEEHNYTTPAKIVNGKLSYGLNA
ncbi:MAG TPA: DUF488 domain-containing protein [Chitinophagaceae bacterium]|nr:DUF488 domain-containing protein [Chitinophagaceae bacterium]